MDHISLDIQNKIMNIVKDRQTQINELKVFFNRKTTKLYKDIVRIDQSQFEDLYSKRFIRERVENLLSISASIGKILNLNNSIKTILVATKVFQEHESFTQAQTQSPPKRSFIYKMFESNSLCPLVKNPSLLTKNHLPPAKQFYQALFNQETNFWSDFNSYLNFQLNVKQKPNEVKVNIEDITTKMNKLFQGSTVNYYKIYSRVNSVLYVYIEL